MVYCYYLFVGLDVLYWLLRGLGPASYLHIYRQLLLGLDSAVVAWEVDVWGLDSAAVWNYETLSVDVEELDSFVGNALVAYRIFVEDCLYVFLFFIETDHVDLLVLALDLHGDVLNLIHVSIDSILKPSEPPLLYKGLSNPLALPLMEDKEVDPAWIFNIIDMLDNRINLIKLDIKWCLLVNKVNRNKYQLNPAINFLRFRHQILWHKLKIFSLDKDSHE